MLGTGAIALFALCLWIISRAVSYIMLWLRAKYLLIEYMWHREEFIAWYRWHEDHDVDALLNGLQCNCQKCRELREQIKREAGR